MPRLRALLKSPPLAKGDAEQQLEELRDYLLQIVEELGYLLTHIEADNINDTTFERISQMIPKAFTGTPTMDGEGSPGTAPTWARGDHTHPKDSSKADVTALAAHIADRLNPHAVTKAQVGLGNVADERQYSAQNPPPVPSAEDVGAIPATEKGSAGGVAELDANGMVPSAQLPSYVDDVLEYASLSAFPVTGESGKIYVALDTNRTYRWSGSAYTEISESLALGETSSTAYRGDRGKAAYDHSQLTSGNPHNVTAADVGAVPTSREVNGHALSSDISLTASDVGARVDTWMPSASDVGAQPTITANGILKGDGQGGVTAAVAGTDYGTYSKPSGGIPASDLANGVIPTVPSAYASNPEMDGTASPGTSNDYARGDHAHPVDTSRASASAVASLNNRYTDNTLWISNSDANDYKTSGMYAMATGNANIPATWGILFVIAPRNDTIEQEYRCSGNIWNREFRSNTWSAWTQAVKQSQLAYMETGTTATKTGGYTAGEYICWQGTLYTANTNIAYGTTLSAGTGGNLTECVGGGFNSVRVSHLDYVTTSDLTLSPMSNGFYDVTSAIPAGYEPISGKIVAPTVHAQSYLMVWFNEWMGTIRCNVFLIGELARTVPTGTKIRIFYVKK